MGNGQKVQAWGLRRAIRVQEPQVGCSEKLELSEINPGSGGAASEPDPHFTAEETKARQGRALLRATEGEGGLLWGGLPRPGFLHTVLKIVFLSDPKPFGDWVESTEQNWAEKGIQGTWGVSAAPQICFSFTLWACDFTSSLSSWMWSWTGS